MAEEWHALPVELALARAGSGEHGLTDDEAARRIAVHGPNRLPRPEGDGPWRILWRQVDNPLIMVLVAAALVAALLGETTDAAVVGAVVVINSVIGFFQEYRAGRAIEALSSLVPENVTVVRSGRRRTVPAEALVPGDQVLLASGDKVPADLRLLEVKGLRIEEAALTGESLPVGKSTAAVAQAAALGDRHDLAFAGTLVASGTATGLVVATGGATELGRISGLLQQAGGLETPLTRALGGVGRALSLGILGLTALLIAAGAWRSIGHGMAPLQAVREMLIFAISLAVGAIPEGLPAIVTIALAIGVQRMARRGAIIRKLPAVETLGSTSVICSDKTGTLTRNELTVVSLWTPGQALEVEGIGWSDQGGFTAEGRPVAPAEAVHHLLTAALLCSDATVERRGMGWTVTGDPTEAALVVAARKAGLDPGTLRAASPRRDVIPFESELQYMATLQRLPGGDRLQVVMKGAPEVVLARCEPAARAEGMARLEALAGRGLRVLAVAIRHWDAGAAALAPETLGSDLQLLGLLGMIDPPRSEAVAAVAACHAAGIEVKMITGDHAGTAQAIGRQLGLLRAGSLQALNGAALEALDQDGLRRVATEGSVFARVTPEQKLRLVQALQAQGNVVAMTGDGVNDAPALKQADVGVAMGITGTSVSREAADMVLTDDNFATIVAAVEEGRRVYDNLVKSLAFVLPTNLGLALIFVCAVFAFPFDATTGLLLLPVRPTQLLWINLVAAVTLALPLAFESMEPDLMRRPPGARDAPLLSWLVLRRTAMASLLMTASAVGFFLFEWRRGLASGDPPALALAEAQTMAVTAILFFQVFYLLESRSLAGSVFGTSLLSNPVLLPGIGAVLGLQAALIWWPPLQAIFGTASLEPVEVGSAALVAAVIFPAMAIEKALTRRLRARG